jgi:hypothetical protein
VPVQSALNYKKSLHLTHLCFSKSIFSHPHLCADCICSKKEDDYIKPKATSPKLGSLLVFAVSVLPQGAVRI